VSRGGAGPPRRAPVENGVSHGGALGLDVLRELRIFYRIGSRGFRLVQRN